MHSIVVLLILAERSELDVAPLTVERFRDTPVLVLVVQLQVFLLRVARTTPLTLVRLVCLVHVVHVPHQVPAPEEPLATHVAADAAALAGPVAAHQHLPFHVFTDVAVLRLQVAQQMFLFHKRLFAMLTDEFRIVFRINTLSTFNRRSPLCF